MTDIASPAPALSPLSKLCTLHNALAGGLSRAAAATLPTLARFAFAAVLLTFFWNSAATKLDGLFTPTLGSYAQVFPKAMEAVGYDVSQLSGVHTLVVLAGAWAEYALPALVVIGLFTRLAALGMIGFVAVMSLVDITGHGVDAATSGAWFDGASGSLILDQRLFWVVILLTLVLKGAGPLSADRLLGLK